MNAADLSLLESGSNLKNLKIRVRIFAIQAIAKILRRRRKQEAAFCYSIHPINIFSIDILFAKIYSFEKDTPCKKIYSLKHNKIKTLFYLFLNEFIQFIFFDSLENLKTITYASMKRKTPGQNTDKASLLKKCWLRWGCNFLLFFSFDVVL